MRYLVGLGAAVALASLLASAATPSSARPASHADGRAVLVTRRIVAFLASDRGRAALGLSLSAVPDSDVTTVAVWNPARRSVRRFDTDVRKQPIFISGIALAENTLAWLGQVFPCACQAVVPMVVMHVRLDRKSRPQVAAFTYFGGGGGYFLGDIHSGGSRIAFDTWYLCDPAGDVPACDTLPREDEGNLETQAFSVGVGTAGACVPISAGSYGDDEWAAHPDPRVRCQQITNSSGGTPILAVDGDRLAIGEPDGSIALLDDTGATLATLNPTRGPIKAVALNANEVVLLVRIARGRAAIEVHDPTGALERSLTVPGNYKTMGEDSCGYDDLGVASFGCDVLYPSLRLDSAAKGIVVYTLNKTLHALRINDQRDVTIANSLHASALHAQLDQSGLVYSYDVHNKRYPGRVVHLSWKALAQLLDHKQ